MVETAIFLAKGDSSMKPPGITQPRRPAHRFRPTGVKTRIVAEDEIGFVYRAKDPDTTYPP
jgi:hypothetical protein